MDMRIACTAAGGLVTSLYSAYNLYNINKAATDYKLDLLNKDLMEQIEIDVTNQYKKSAININDPILMRDALFKQNVLNPDGEVSRLIKSKNEYDQLGQAYIDNSWSFYTSLAIAGITVTAISLIALKYLSKKEQENTPAEEVEYQPRSRRRTPVYANNTLSGSSASSSSSISSSVTPVIDEEAEKQKELEIQKLEAAARQNEEKEKAKQNEIEKQKLAEEIARQQEQIRLRFLNQSNEADRASTGKKYKARKA